MNVELVTPSVSNCALRLYESGVVTQNTHVSDWHIHGEIEMILMLTGSKDFYINDKKITIRAGDIIFVNGNIPHKTETPIGSSCVLMQFRTSSQSDDAEDFQTYHIGAFSDTAYCVFEKGSEINTALTDCIQKICREYSEKRRSFETFIKSYICEVTAILYRNEILSDFGDWQKRVLPLKGVLEYIDRHHGEHISLAEISKISGFHSSYFCKYFKNILGVSFIEYLNLVRLGKAKALMKNTAKSITEISYQVGFSSVSYFIKIFKKYNYCSPNKYRALAINK